MPFDAISYLLARKALSQGIRLPTLKDLVIDADKDWQGYKIKNLGEPISPYDAARRIYVDIATTGLGINYYLLDEADAEVPAYKKMSITPPNLTEAYVEIEEDSVGDYLIQEWIAEPDGIPVVRLGVYTIHFQSEIVGGGAKIRFFFRLYERESGGTENLIVESTPSNRIEKERENVVTSAVLTSDYVMATGSRLVLKLYARWEENRSATVRIYYQGAVNSRLTVPTVREILDRIYAGITHASRHVLGGPDELSLDAAQIASGTFDVARIPDLDASKITSGVLDLARIPNIDWTRISANFPRAISDLISSAFSRSWISDFFASPFWDSIPDKPSTFPPDLHASAHSLGGADELSLDASQITSGTLSAARIPNLDASKITSGVFDVARIPDLSRSKITDFFSTPFWDNIPDKPSVFPPDLHASTHAKGGADELSLDASQITSGTLDLARIPQGSGSGLDADTVDGKHYSDLQATTPQDVTASRALDTPYQNTTGKTKIVIVTLYFYGREFDAEFRISPDNTWTTVIPISRVGMATAEGGGYFVLYGVVPKGYYYTVATTQTDVTDFSLDRWVEYEIP